MEKVRPASETMDVVEEDMKKMGVVQQDAGDELEEESSERTGQPLLAGKIRQE